MRLSFLRGVGFCLMLGTVGAGCASAPLSPKVAEPFRAFPSQQTVAEKQGFGTLPTFPLFPSTAVITLEEPVPTLPDAVTVLRWRTGLPNETEFRNITGALGLPGTLLGDLPQARSLQASWSAPSGIAWSYEGVKKTLSFQTPRVSSPLTLSSLPASSELIRAATAFFQTHALPYNDMLDPQLVPDWNTWWRGQQEADACMTLEAVLAIRDIAKNPQSFPQFPALPPREGRSCSATEFPTTQRIVFPAAKDGLEIVRRDGSSVEGADFYVDASRLTVLSGSINLPRNVDRSDYPAADARTMESRLLAGGLSGASGEIRITGYAQAYLEQGEYLIPALIGKGFRKTSEESEQPFRIVVPML